MKKTLTLMLCVLMLTMLALPTMAAPSGKDAGIVEGTTEELVLDGEMDDAYLNGLMVESFTETDGKKGDTDAIYYITYTEDALWVFCEIRDDTLETKLANEAQPNYQMDSIEIMLDPDNKAENVADKTPYQMRIDYQGNLSARKGQSGTSLYHSPDKKGNVDFFEAVAVIVDGGFDAEYRIPLDDLEAGREIGFNFCYNDWDATGKERVCYNTTLKTASWTVTGYDYFVLGDLVEPAVEEAGATENAPATADLTVIALIAAVSSFGAAAAVRRNRK